MLAAIQLKKGYYICHVNEGLWSTFGVNQIKLFSEKDSKAQMLEWKKNSKKVYNDLYNPCDPDDLNSEIFLSLIIKYVFVSDDERTQANAVWTQAVLETIFDEEYLFPKIDTNYVNTWIQKLSNNEKEKDNENVCILFINKLTNFFEHILFYFIYFFFRILFCKKVLLQCQKQNL